MSDVAFLFPGQGAQAVGMGRDLAEANPACRAWFDRASEILGYDLATICFEGPLETLTQSSHAQPGIFVTSLAAWTAIQERAPGLSMKAAAGLSSGEWTALHLAGVVGFEDTLKILEARGRLMQAACTATPGSMLSVIGAEPEQLAHLCAESGAEIANLNSREQTVISGTREAIDRAEGLAKDVGIRKAIRLNVAGAFHSTLMKPAAEQFAGVLASISFQAPSFPVYANLTGRPHEADGDAIRESMISQVYSSVHWYQSVEAIVAGGTTTFLECGPGKVLAGLVKRIDKTAKVHSIQDQSGLEGLAGFLAG
ncbi:MAG TPA: ACP S-malonyltransferase [Kiritimatiellia bacterium]|nr:ACP S-malonyltransferase [Kiritimatiellia bacterium]